MNKKASFFIASIITLLIVGNYLFFSDEGVIREKVQVSKVLDGDTIEIMDGRKIRLLNINTPEKGLAYSELSKNYLSTFSEIELESVGEDIYGRTLGKLFYKNKYLNLEIVKMGYAHSYLVEDSEERYFLEAENYARKNSLNIWEKSKYYGCLKVEINKYQEYLQIIDSCDINFTGWSIKDESTKSYTFDKDVDQIFKLHSNKGTDSSKEIFWGRENIWNDDHDEIFVRDSNGLLVYYDSYG